MRAFYLKVTEKALKNYALVISEGLLISDSQHSFYQIHFSCTCVVAVCTMFHFFSQEYVCMILGTVSRCDDMIRYMCRQYQTHNMTAYYYVVYAMSSVMGTHLLQAATQHLMEVKQKVAREVARKQAAQAAIALGKEELRSGKNVPPSQGMVRFSVDLPSGEMQKQGAEKKGGSVVEKPHYRYRSPVAVSSHLKKISKEAHRTWQRGTRV